MAEPGPMINATRLELHALLARHADAVMRRHPEDWIETWAPDASWIVDGEESKGREAILERWSAELAAWPLVIHTVYAPNLVITDGVARGRCTVQEIRQAQDGSARQIFGVYHDEFARGDAWLFHRRRFDVLLSRPLDLGEAQVHGWPADVDPDFLR